MEVLLQCRSLKEKLSQQNQATASVLHRNRNLVIQMSRDEFNALIMDRVTASVEMTRQLLEEIKANNHTVDSVILIGGSSRIPLIREKLKEVLPVEPLETMAADVAVALGAAIPSSLSLGASLDFIKPKDYDTLGLKRGEFETIQEWQSRIAALPPVQIGEASFDRYDIDKEECHGNFKQNPKVLEIIPNLNKIHYNQTFAFPADRVFAQSIVRNGKWPVIGTLITSEKNIFIDNVLIQIQNSRFPFAYNAIIAKDKEQKRLEDTRINEEAKKAKMEEDNPIKTGCEFFVLIIIGCLALALIESCK